MKKKVFTKARYLLALVCLVLLGTNVAVAQETFAPVETGEFGLTQAINESDKTLGSITLTGVEIISLTQEKKRELLLVIKRINPQQRLPMSN